METIAPIFQKNCSEFIRQTYSTVIQVTATNLHWISPAPSIRLIIWRYQILSADIERCHMLQKKFEFQNPFLRGRYSLLTPLNCLKIHFHRTQCQHLYMQTTIISFIRRFFALFFNYYYNYLVFFTSIIQIKTLNGNSMLFVQFPIWISPLRLQHRRLLAHSVNSDACSVNHFKVR